MSGSDGLWVLTNEGDHSSGLSADNFALLQVSCALNLERKEERTPFRGGSPSIKQIKERRGELERWFAPSPFHLEPLRHHEPSNDSPPADSWLVPQGPRGTASSRHAVLEFARYCNFATDNPGFVQLALPPLLHGLVQPTSDPKLEIRPRIRIQHARKMRRAQLSTLTMRTLRWTIMISLSIQSPSLSRRCHSMRPVCFLHSCWHRGALGFSDQT